MASDGARAYTVSGTEQSHPEADEVFVSKTLFLMHLR